MLTVVLQAAPVPPGFGDMQVVQAIEALEHGHPETALTALRSYLLQPRHGTPLQDARFTAARAALQLGRAKEALRYIKNIELPEIDDYLWQLRARAYRTLGDWQRAREAWQRIQNNTRSPLREDAQFGLADAAFALGEYDAAKIAYEKAIRRAQSNERAIIARYNLGRIAEMQGRWHDAAWAFRRIVYRYPSHPFNEPSERRLSFLLGMSLSPTPSLREQLGRVDRLISAHSFEDATQHLNQLRPLIRTDFDARAILYRDAKLAYRSRQYDQAVVLFQQLANTRNKKQRIEYERWIARTYSTAGRTHEAIAVHLSIAARSRHKRTIKEALFKAAWLAYNGGEYTEALRLFGRSFKSFGRDRDADDVLWYIAWNAYHLGDLPTAAATLARLRSTFPKSALMQRTLYWEGRIALQMGQSATAKERLLATVQKRPLSYYGAMAQLLLKDLSNIAMVQARGVLLATTGPIMRPNERFGLTTDELPIDGGLKPLGHRYLPFGAAVFDWTSVSGKRAIRLMRLGLVNDAAAVIAKVPVLPGHTREEISYARARLLFGLGDFARAYRVTTSTFRTALLGKPTGRTRRYFHMAYPTAFAHLVQTAAFEFGIEPLAVLALIRQESAFLTRARSSASAKGLMQIIPSTGKKIAKRLNIVDYDYSVLRDPAMNVRLGTWYLAELNKKFHGNLALAIASYNAGPIAVTRWVDMRPNVATDEFIEDIPFYETRTYVKRVLSNFATYKTLYGNTPFHVNKRIPQNYLDNVGF